MGETQQAQSKRGDEEVMVRILANSVGKEPRFCRKVWAQDESEPEVDRHGHYGV